MVDGNNKHFVKNVTYKFKGGLPYKVVLDFYLIKSSLIYSTLSKKVTLSALRKGKKMVITDCFKMEYKLVQKILVSFNLYIVQN